LRAWLTPGRPLPVEQALLIALQIVRGMKHATETIPGFVHRDLKPENVFLTSEGRVKILDFGLSKLVHPASDVQRLPTGQTLTEAGMVVGSAGYMSPEQVRGHDLDHRSDIFSLGAILYEMLMGRRAFQADSMAETMALILSAEPHLAPEVQDRIPPALARIVGRCLEKPLEQRFQSARDLAFQLESLSAFSAAVPSRTSDLERRIPRRPVLALAASLVLGGLAGAGAMRWVAGAGPGRSAAIPELQRVTFRRGIVRSARFAPDGQSVVYGASWDGEPVRLFSARPGTPESRPLDVGDAEILDIAPQGDMAVLLGGGETRYSPRRRNRVLARVPLGGGVPRELMKDALWAAWTPDGRRLAVVREAGGKQRLELPAGTTLYETSGWISHPRVSPDGTLVAFLDHPVRGDDRGAVAVVERSGARRVLSDGWTSLQGLAFSASTGEVWYTGATRGMARGLWATAIATGRTRPLATMAGPLMLHDVSSDGRALLTHDSYQASLNVLAPGASREVDLAWLDSSGVNDLSSDGRALLFTEQGDGGGAHYSVYFRRTGGPAVRLGDGQGLALSPDQSSALAVIYDGPELVILPTGIGEPATLPRGEVAEVHWADFTPDGRGIIFAGSRAGAGARLYAQSLSGGSPRPITPEGFTTAGHPITADGREIAVLPAGGPLALIPLEGGEPRPIAGAEPGDLPVRFSADGRSLFLHRGNDIPLTIERLDLASGRKELWKSLQPSDLAGVRAVGPVRLTADGKGYAYNASRFLSSLYVLMGAR
jgi:hypothetical protein